VNPSKRQYPFVCSAETTSVGHDTLLAEDEEISVEQSETVLCDKVTAASATGYWRRGIRG